MKPELINEELGTQCSAQTLDTEILMDLMLMAVLLLVWLSKKTFKNMKFVAIKLSPNNLK